MPDEEEDVEWAEETLPALYVDRLWAEDWESPEDSVYDDRKPA
jgi:hypothetical protein